MRPKRGLIEHERRFFMQTSNRIGKIFVSAGLLSLLLLICASVVFAAEEPLDREKFREIRQKMRRGEELTEEEKAYIERARAEFRNRRGERARPEGRRGERGQRPEGRRPRGPRAEGKETTGLIPLTEMGSKKYKEQSGGLYGNGKNTPPAAHQKAAEKELAKIQPLDAKGKPARDGKIVLISLGMSNTTQEFSFFKRLADADPNKSPGVVIVDCAQGGMAAHQWAYPPKPVKEDADKTPKKDSDKGGEKREGQKRRSPPRRQRPSPWIGMDQRIERAGVTPAQVQAVWIKLAQMGPANLGEFPKHAKTIQDDSVVILNKLKEKFPNLRVAYNSSRIYAGYAGTPLNPEPYAYEGGFAVRWLIEDQIKGNPALNYDSKKGRVKSPLLLWGPYLWGDGVKARKDDGLVWKREDLAGDGTHPSMSGRKKVAELLLKFFKTDPLAKTWFLKSTK